MKNKNVIECFIERKKAKSWTKNLHTDGTSVYSYALKIAEHYDDEIYVFNYARFLGGGFVSMTTSCHLSKVLNGIKWNRNKYHIIDADDYEKLKISNLDNYLIKDLQNIVLSYLTIKY
jgi:hypothetical protein